MYRKVQAYSQTSRSGQPHPLLTLLKMLTSDPRRQLGILGDVTD